MRMQVQMQCVVCIDILLAPLQRHTRRNNDDVSGLNDLFEFSSTELCRDTDCGPKLNDDAVVLERRDGPFRLLTHMNRAQILPAERLTRHDYCFRTDD